MLGRRADRICLYGVYAGYCLSSARCHGCNVRDESTHLVGKQSSANDASCSDDRDLSLLMLAADSIQCEKLS